MFPEIEASFDRVSSETPSLDTDKPVGDAFVFDFPKGQHTIVNGRMVKCQSLEAIAQWIEVVLRTEPGTYKVYTVDEPESFGVHTKRYVGVKSYPTGFIASELKREITEQLTANPFISGIEDFAAVKEKRGLNISFTVLLADGGRLAKEMVISGL